MEPTPRFRGPSIVLLASVHIVLFGAGLVAGSVLRHGGSFVTPFAPGEQVRMFFNQSSMAVRVSSFLLFGSAVPFGIFAVTTVSRLRFMGVRAAGTNITLFGGMVGAIALFFSGIAGWVLSVPDVSDSVPAVKAVYLLSFLCGGILYAIGFGLFAAGVSVTSYFTRLLPRWLIFLGILVAITGELSWFSLIAYPANFFIPITRFAGFLWMLLAAVALTRGRGTVQPSSTGDSL